MLCFFLARPSSVRSVTEVVYQLSVPYRSLYCVYVYVCVYLCVVMVCAFAYWYVCVYACVCVCARNPSWNPAGVGAGNQEGPECGAREEGALQRAVPARPLDQTRVVRMVGECNQRGECIQIGESTIIRTTLVRFSGRATTAR